MKKIFSVIFCFFLCVFLIVCSMYGLSEIFSSFHSEYYLFYEQSPLASNLFAPLAVLPAFFLSYLVLYFINGRKYDPLHWIELIKLWRIWNVIPIILFELVLYFCLFNVTIVTPDKIIVKTTFDPKGKEYTYSQVEKIETGFGNKKFTLWEHEKKGSFYYKIYLDGEERVFHLPSPNEEIERYNDTYYELEEFDTALVKENVPKESSDKGWEKCNFDQRYVDRFLRIINKKNTD